MFDHWFTHLKISINQNMFLELCIHDITYDKCRFKDILGHPLDLVPVLSSRNDFSLLNYWVARALGIGVSSLHLVTSSIILFVYSIWLLFCSEVQFNHFRSGKLASSKFFARCQWMCVWVCEIEKPSKIEVIIFKCF